MLATKFKDFRQNYICGLGEFKKEIKQFSAFDKSKVNGSDNDFYDLQVEIIDPLTALKNSFEASSHVLQYYSLDH